MASTEPFFDEVRTWGELQEAWVERAAIMEIDGGLSRADAERAAWEGIKRRAHQDEYVQGNGSESQRGGEYGSGNPE